MHTEHTYIPLIYIYTYIHGWPYREQTDAQSTHIKTNSINGIIVLSPLAEQDRGPLVRG